MNLVAGGEVCSSAGRIILLTMALFLLGTKMVRFSISIQPSISPHGLTVAHCTRAVFLKVRDVNNDKIKNNKIKKSRRNLLSPPGPNAFSGSCACADAQFLTRRRFAAKKCHTAYLILLFGVLAGSDSPFFLAALVFLTGFGSATSSARS